jgi:hypothetical protein
MSQVKEASLKKLLLIVAIASMAAIGGYAQIPNLSQYANAMDSFNQSVASTLTLNSDLGSTWSDAYIGGFPHFGIGATLGSTFAINSTASQIFDLFGSQMPDTLKSTLGSLGLPVPATALSFKIGLPFLPIDIGIKGGYIPPSVSNSLQSATGIGVSYEDVGLTVRYALIKQDLLLPNVSIGLSYDFQSGEITAPTGLGAQSVNFGSGYSISMTDPNLDMKWTSNTFDLTAQVSKTLLFFVTPYLGAGYTIGTASVSTGLTTTVTPVGTDLGTLESLASSQGLSLSDTGLLFTGTVTNPVLRLYGGFSLNILVIRLDFQAVYVPAMAITVVNQSQAFGASASVRVQL